MSFFGCSVFFQRTSFCEAAVRAKWVERLADLSLLGQVCREPEEVVLEVVLLQSKSVFDTRLERGRLQHGDDVLDSSLRRQC